jgi:hypothetical protein
MCIDGNTKLYINTLSHARADILLAGTSNNFNALPSWDTITTSAKIGEGNQLPIFKILN